MTGKSITLLSLNQLAPSLFCSNQNDCFSKQEQIIRKTTVAQQDNWPTLINVARIFD